MQFGQQSGIPSNARCSAGSTNDGREKSKERSFSREDWASTVQTSPVLSRKTIPNAMANRELCGSPGAKRGGLAQWMRKSASMNPATETNVHKLESSTLDAAREQARMALADLEQGQRDAMEALRMALCGYVGALRRSGSTREATLAAVRAFVATPATPDGAMALTPIVRDALAELTLEWCAAEYDRLAGDSPA